MRQDIRNPVLMVSCDDSQVVAEIDVELVDTIPECLDQRWIACVELGLIKAEHERTIVGGEQAKPLQSSKTQIIHLLGRGVPAALAIGRVNPKHRDLVRFERLGAEPFHGSAPTLTIGLIERLRGKHFQPRLFAPKKVDTARLQAGGEPTDLAGIVDQLCNAFDPRSYLRFGQLWINANLTQERRRLSASMVPLLAAAKALAIQNPNPRPEVIWE
jgi:hypothetical protein